jgi:HEAT repeat protein
LDNSHLANPLFSLRQIIVRPRLLAPKPAIDPGVDDQLVDRYHSILPTLPDWNTLSGIYRTPSISLTKVLDTKSNILITGEIGSGKSTALAYLAFEILQARNRRSSDEQRMVILFHAIDLLSNLSESDETSLEPVIAAARQSASTNLSGFVPRYIRNQLNNNEAILLIDGLDELPASQLSSIANWLKVFAQNNPQHQIIAVGPPRGYDGILKAGRFIPLVIAPWSKHEIEIFLSKWAQAWQTSVQPTLPGGGVAEVDPALLNAWLQVSRPIFNPLEITLKVWSSYIGDLQSPKLTDSLLAYVRRMISPNEQHAAQFVALNWLRARTGFIDEGSINERAPISSLIEAKIITRRGKKNISFANPSIGAFLAAQAFALEKIEQIEFNEDWQPAIIAVRHYASIADMTEPIRGMKELMNDPLNRALLSSAAWLREAPPDIHWRNHILSPLAVLIQDDSQTYSIRLRALNAIVDANEKPAQALFQKMLGSNSPESRVFGALGLGGLCATESVPDLLAKNVPQEDEEVRLAICMALAVIGSSQALIGLGKWLIEGDDASQLFAAEALASHEGEGFSMLEDATTMENVRIRRAAVYGLKRVLSDRADAILHRIEADDDQAIVKNAATEVLELRRIIPSDLSPPPDDLSNLPWLVAYAAEGGLGMTPGKGAHETLRRALMGGSKRQRIAALEAITRFGAHELVLDVLKVMEAEDMDVKDAAYEALWCLEASGVNYGAAFESSSVNQPSSR